MDGEGNDVLVVEAQDDDEIVVEQKDKVEGSAPGGEDSNKGFYIDFDDDGGHEL